MKILYSMEAIIVNFRQGRHHQKPNHIILLVKGYDHKDKSQELIGKKVVYTTISGKNKIHGEVKATHGNKGCVRAIFEKGLPGQAVGTKIELN